MRTLVVNTGSSSLKLQVHEDAASAGTGDPVGSAEPGDPGGSLVADDHVAGWDGQDLEPVTRLVERAGPVDVVGHRIVHGGPGRSGPAPVTDQLVDELRDLTPLAPLHQGRGVAGIVAARAAVPDVPHVACFDTTYHSTLPEAAATYALPREWRERWPLRRFGFHGLSHAYAARRAASLAPGDAGPGTTARSAGLRVVSCHLGAGASLCASLGGRSVDTTMGFTPLEGLVMATRSGTVDPGLVLWLLTEAGLTATDVTDALERGSGLQGLAGTSDMREVLDRRRAGDAAARLAVDVYVHVLAGQVAAMTAALGGLDALVFTGGVGEHAAEVRAAAADRLAYLGVELDPQANEAAVEQGDRSVGAPGAAVATLVVEAREDLEIVRQVRSLLS